MEKLKIAPMNWKFNAKGIPEDAFEVMDFFNRGLKSKSYPFIPRKSKITKKEILELWLPAKNDNINYVAKINRTVVGSGTVLVNKKSNKYSQESKRNNNEYSVVIDPKFAGKRIEEKITKAVIEEAKKRKIKFQTHVYSKNTDLIEALNNLGYTPKRSLRPKRYIKIGMKEKVYIYELP